MVAERANYMADWHGYPKEASAMPSISQALVELAGQVRSDTLRILESTPDGALTWAPPGTANFILWHAGHALWLQDLMCVVPLSGKSQLPAGWKERFGQGSDPQWGKQWPCRDEVVRLLVDQLQQMQRLLATASDETLLGSPRNLSPSRNTLGWIIHGLHDEAKHSGEMYLLWKLWRQRRG